MASTRIRLLGSCAGAHHVRPVSGEGGASGLGTPGPVAVCSNRAHESSLVPEGDYCPTHDLQCVNTKSVHAGSVAHRKCLRKKKFSNLLCSLNPATQTSCSKTESLTAMPRRESLTWSPFRKINPLDTKSSKVCWYLSGRAVPKRSANE